MVHWNRAGANTTPKWSLLYHKSPLCVFTVRYFCDSYSRSIYWYACDKSNVENFLPPASDANISLILGMRYMSISQLCWLLAYSTHKRSHYHHVSPLAQLVHPNLKKSWYPASLISPTLVSLSLGGEMELCVLCRTMVWCRDWHAFYPLEGA